MDLTSRFSGNGHVDGIPGNGALLPGLEGGVGDVSVVGNGVKGKGRSRTLEDSRAGLEEKSRHGEARARNGEGARTLEDARAGLGRDESGRFAEGNKGGPGNPYNRKVAQLKGWLAETVGEEEIKAIGKKLSEMAQEGCVAAARVLFQYVLPKNVEPDRVDMDEWAVLKEAGSMFGEVPEMMNKPEAELPLKMVRVARPMMTETLGRMTGNLLSTPQDRLGEVMDLLKNDPKGAREYLERGAERKEGAGRARNGKKGKAQRRKR